MNSDDIDSFLQNIGRNIDPKTSEGMSFWKNSENTYLWDGFDSKSYAFFLLLRHLDDSYNYDDCISESLSRRARGQQQVFDAYLTEINGATGEVLTDLRDIWDKYGNAQMKLHYFGSPKFQMRWVAPGS